MIKNVKNVVIIKNQVLMDYHVFLLILHLPTIVLIVHLPAIVLILHQITLQIKTMI